jgi:hypothetical protein
VAEQIPQTLHDGQAEAETPAPLTRGVVELMVLLEDRLKLPVGDANAGIPDLDAQDAAAPSATKQHLAGAGVFQRVGQQLRIIFSSSRGSLSIGRDGRTADRPAHPAR